MKQTSGGVTIVKLNSPTVRSNEQSPILKNTSATVGLTIDALNIAAPSYLVTKSNNTNNVNGLLADSITSDNKSITSQSTSTSAVSSGGHIVTIHTTSITSSATNANNNTTSSVPSSSSTTQHTGYTRRAKFGDSRSTGRLHSAGNTHRSMTRLNIAGNYYLFFIYANLVKFEENWLK